MEKESITYHDKGNIETLCTDLRTMGFRVPYIWRELVNDPNIDKNIYPKRGSINEKTAIGNIEIEKRDEKHSVAEFRLDVYLNRRGHRKLVGFANEYETSMEEER